MSKIYHVIIKNENMDTEDEGLLDLEYYIDPLTENQSYLVEEHDLSEAIKRATNSPQICAVVSRDAAEYLMANAPDGIYPCTVLGKIYLNIED